MLLSQLASAQTITLAQTTFQEGETIVVEFSGGPGNSTDWIGIYSDGEVPDGSPPALDWNYLNGTRTSGGNLTEGAVTFASPGLVSGTYDIWFLASDGYTALDGPLEITVAPPVVGEPEWLMNEFRRRHGVVGVAYSGKISGYTNSPTFTFSKVAGPAWLNVSEQGELSGMPDANDRGVNTFQVRATGATSNEDATLRIPVFASGTEVVPRLKVMSYNAWHGWGQIAQGHRKGLESIILADVDIVGMQESTDNVSGSGIYQPQKLADDLGWFYRSGISGSLGVLSRYPISDQTLAAGIARGAKIRVTGDPLQEVILMNCHLDYTDYGPYASEQSGATETSVLAVETTSDRDEQIASIVAAMQGILANAEVVPVLLTGDFNAPSHLDWTEATASTHHGVGNVAWPTSTAVLNAGMQDSYREIHSDPLAKPGVTWSPVFKGTEPQDRIDFVYFKGSRLQPIASEVYTTAVEATVGRWGAGTGPIVNNTWPSDHASVVTTFHLTPVDSDEDGLSDAFENKYFPSLASQSGANDADGDGVSNQVEQWMATNPIAAFSFPRPVLVPPTSSVEIPSYSFSLSPSAFEVGLVCERSHDLDDWDTLWSYRADPFFTDSNLSVVEGFVDSWTLHLSDNGLDPLLRDRAFYRLRSGE